MWKKSWKQREYGLYSLFNELEVHCSQRKLLAGVLSQLNLAKQIRFVLLSALDWLHSDTHDNSRSHNSGIFGFSHTHKDFWL